VGRARSDARVDGDRAGGPGAAGEHGAKGRVGGDPDQQLDALAGHRLDEEALALGPGPGHMTVF
jgi:hypothetical protein